MQVVHPVGSLPLSALGRMFLYLVLFSKANNKRQAESRHYWLAARREPTWPFLFGLEA